MVGNQPNNSPPKDQTVLCNYLTCGRSIFGRHRTTGHCSRQCDSQRIARGTKSMSSQRVWAIAALVHLICSHILEYRGQDLKTYIHQPSRRALARCALYLNHSISRIATEVLWRELDSLKPLQSLLPPDYVRKVGYYEQEQVSCLYCCTH